MINQLSPVSDGPKFLCLKKPVFLSEEFLESGRRSTFGNIDHGLRFPTRKLWWGPTLLYLRRGGVLLIVGPGERRLARFSFCRDIYPAFVGFRNFSVTGMT